MTLIDVNTLPTLLCGPILRRVDTHLVSVFVALKEKRWVQVKLYNDTHTFDDHANFIDNPIDLPGFNYDLHEPIQLGQHLFVVVATAKISPSATGLQRGHRYGYNVFFHDSDDGNGGYLSLASPDLHLLKYDNPYRIGFAQGHLPSFAVPPDNLEQLNIVHGSCRKPHGEGLDMLALLDNTLAVNDAHLDGYQRPHMLILGGDQIYADDVSPPLLKLIHETSKALLGWDETFTGTSPAGTHISDELQALKTHVDDTLAAGAEITNSTLETLTNLLISASERVTWSDNKAANFVVKKSIKWQLKRYEEKAQAAIQESAATHGEKIYHSLKDWFTIYEQIFTDLSSNQTWGQVALTETQKDKIALDEIHSSLANILISTSTDANALLEELETTLTKDVDNPKFSALIDNAQIQIHLLRNQALITINDVITLAQRFIDFFFTDEVEPYIPSRISPPQRAFELKQFADLTSDAMTAHLMFLGEFYAMYLLSWSDILWPTREENGKEKFDLPKYFESVPNYGLTGDLGPNGLKKANESLEEFAASLKQVRRVLANIPTLMMFDDHEITDDWNLNEDWVRKVNTSPMGAQILRNGLLAYAIFQDWGNQPEDYEPNNIGHTLLQDISFHPPGSGEDTLAPAIVRLEPAALARINTTFGTGPNIQFIPSQDGASDDNPPAYTYLSVTGRKRWDWSYRINHPDRPIKIISLDTRTHRGFPTDQWAIRLEIPLGGAPSVGGKIAAAALIHPEELERQLSHRLEQDAMHLIISPAPVFGLPLVEDLAQRFQVLSSGPEVADFESWQANPHGFGLLLATLRNADCLLISGDVHYAYSNYLTFPEENPVTPPHLLMQVCSSSMKNETVLTQTIGAIGRNGRVTDLLIPNAVAEIKEIIGNNINALGKTLSDLGGDLANFGEWFDETAPLVNPFNPNAWVTYYLKLKDIKLYSLSITSPHATLAVGKGIILYAIEDFISGDDGEFNRSAFTMNFLKDIRNNVERRDRAIELTGSQANDLLQRLSLPEERLAEMSEVVGYNNAGRLTFSGSGTEKNDIIHELLWHPHCDDGKPVYRTEPEHSCLSSIQPNDVPLLCSTIHGRAKISMLLKHQIARLAQSEYERWHPQSGIIQERDPEGIRMLNEYKAIMRQFDEQLPPSEDKFSNLWFSETDTSSWSALFISYILYRAQAGSDFFYSIRHIDYMRASYANRMENNDNPFWLYQRNEPEAIVEVGDIVCGTGVQLSDVQSDVMDGGMVATHCDIVVEVDPEHNSAIVIGGNVGITQSSQHGVTANRRDRQLTHDGHLHHPNFFGLIKVREV